MAKRTTKHFNITTTTYDILAKEKRRHDLYALYSFYCYTAIWQDTNPTRCTIEYISTGLGFCTAHIRKLRKRLKALDMIEDIVRERKYYVKVNFMALNTNGLKWPTGQIHNTNKVNTKRTNTTKLPQAANSGELCQIEKTFDEKRGAYLSKIVKTSKKSPPKRTVRAKTWAKELLMLRNKEGIKKKEVDEVLRWYKKHYDDRYTPVLFTAKDLREKWNRIVAAKNRHSEDDPKPIKQTATVKRVVTRLKSKEWRRLEPDALVKAVVLSLENYKIYKRHHKKLHNRTKNHRAIDRFIRRISKEFIFSNEDFIYDWFDTVRKELEDWKEWRGSFKQYVFDIHKDRFKHQIMQLEMDAHNESGRYSTQYFKNLEEIR